MYTDTFTQKPHKTFSTFEHIIRHKVSLNRYKKIEVTPCVLSNNYRLRLDFNNRNKRKPTDSWKLNNSLLIVHLAKEEIKKLQTFYNSIKTKALHTKNYETQ